MLTLLGELPQAVIAEHAEVMRLIEHASLFGRGIGYVDAALLAAVRLSPGATLLTRDRRLHEIATEMKIAWSAQKA